MKKHKITILFTIISIGISLAQANVERGSVLIRNGTVITITKGTLENTDILIRDGKIVQIGKTLQSPAGYKIIDATGMFVMPGIVDAHTHIALDAINESTSPVTAELQMGDAVNPLDISIYRALSGGVTTVHVMHGSSNPIGGQCETLKLRFGTSDPDLLKMEGAPRTIKFALGENPTRTHGSVNNISPKTRMGVEFVIRQALSEARRYMEAWDKYNKNKTQKTFRGTPPAYNLRMETLADLLRGNIIIHCHSYRADEIFMLMKVCKDFGINRLVFQHANEGFKIAPEMAANGVMASVFADEWSYKFEVYYSTAYNAAILARNGVVTSINSDDPDLLRHLYHQAAKTQKYGGLTDDEALALITLNPAKQLGIDNRIGSLEVGKDADIAIFKGHPLSIYTNPMMTIVDGMVRFDREKDPDDMRFYIDIKKNIDAATIDDSDHDRDECMKGAEKCFTTLFGF